MDDAAAPRPDRRRMVTVSAVIVMVVGAVLLAIGLLAGDDGSTRSVTEVPAGTTAPVRGKDGLGKGFGPEHRGRRTLRGFGEVRATITSGKGERCEVCLLAARTEAQRERGLMEVEDRGLGGYDGMVFIYDQPTKGAFWMGNTPLPLSIAYFDRNGLVINTADMAPCVPASASCANYPASGPFLYALEVPQGKLADVQVTGAARIELEAGPCPLRTRD